MQTTVKYFLCRSGLVVVCVRGGGREKNDKETYLKPKDGELSLDSICNRFH